MRRSICTSSFSVQDGSTALHLASQNGHCEVVKILLKAKADVNIKTNVSKNYTNLYPLSELQTILYTVPNNTSLLCQWKWV